VSEAPPATAAPREIPAALRVVLGVTLPLALDALLLALALGGGAALLAHPPALALLAVSGAAGLALAILRPVRGHDAISVERDQRGVLLALFVLPMLAAPLSALGERLGIWPVGGGPGLRWTGVGLCAAGLTLRIAAMAQLGTRFSPLVAIQRTHALETRGLYARVRHPGYLGSWVAALGGTMAFDSALAHPALLLMGGLLWWRTVREETALDRHFGEAYRAYRARSGRFLPRL
jgi:protein-S-isoprenylcysteine O-methyltransferase Ste14